MSDSQFCGDWREVAFSTFLGPQEVVVDLVWHWGRKSTDILLPYPLGPQSAEKRKAMLDELAMETLQEKSQHKEELGAVRLRHEKEVLGVRARYERELRELHEDKKRQEEELRGQIREEKVSG